MGFEKAKIITNACFASLSPVNVFHKQIEQMAYKPDPAYQNKHILFRKKFTCTKEQPTTVRISADDYYKLYINGEFVTQGPAPGYNFSYYYNELDVSAYLQEGENTIAVHTYYQGLINRVWVSGDLRHMLICEWAQGENILVATDESWKTQEHQGFYSCGKNHGYDTAFCEGYDASVAEVGFATPAFDDSAWENAQYKEHCFYQFVKQPTKQLTIYPITPAQIMRNVSGYFIDIGQEIVGYLTFRASGMAGQKIVIHSGEELNEDGTVRYQLRCNCIYQEEFLLGQGECAYQQYDYKAFRYLQINTPEGITLPTDSIQIIVRHYPFAAACSCPVQDDTIQSIWNLCENTIKYGMQEVLMDCPTREKGQYLGDATISAIAATLLTGDATFMKKTLTDFANSAFIAKSLMTVSTSSLMQEIADYSLQFPLQVLWLYRHTGDLDFLRQMQPYVQGVLDDFANYKRPDGLLHNITDKWNMIDWPANLRDDYDFELTQPIGEGCISVINAYYCGAVDAAERIQEILGIPYQSQTQTLNDAFHKAFFDKTTGLYLDAEGSKHSSLHANILPLLFSIHDENIEGRLAFIHQKGITCCGVYMALFLLMTLKKYGKVDWMHAQIKAEGAWCKMLAQGATTCFEAWGKEDKINASLFHPWATAPLIALSETEFPAQ